MAWGDYCVSTENRGSLGRGHHVPLYRVSYFSIDSKRILPIHLNTNVNVSIVRGMTNKKCHRSGEIKWKD